ncbi:hypothetical protein P6166_04495 [Stenotrophomonas sp. HITSZ_GD]|uniref:hypothetical protein n=1 Tax=Stenotrophomonas sp. HITSZ_GD TaxID=3037248 RepID=UPI00240DB3D3|nr:hypothetical protein [Stenotrophomonas sp. HITSZ_GD]MDG2524616.1 hypothetical protein [Stenotrophomonas sp. HITSZ_GD]
MSAGPVHQPGTFNIEAHSGGRWHGGMNRLTREAAIATARTWAARDGSRHRVFDLDGKAIFDTDAAPVDVLAVIDADARASRADRLAQARMSSHSVEESQRAQALWSRSIDARAAVAELIDSQKADARLVAVLLSCLNDNLSEREKGRLGAELMARDLSDHAARRAAALARVGGAS